MFEGNFVKEPERSIPVYQKVEVVVVGGGPAGFGAAVSAARNGANTLLVERSASFGGTGTLGFVPEFHGIENLSGLLKEVIQRLGEQGGAAKEVRPEYFAIAFDIETLKFVLADLVKESGAKVLLNTWVADVIMENRKIKGVIIENKSGRQAVLADVVIDASGDADIAYKSGVPMQEHVVPQPMMMTFRVGGIDYRKIEDYARKNPDNFRRTWGVPPGNLDGAKNGHVSGWYSCVKEGKEKGSLPKNFGNYFSIVGVSPSARENSIGYLYAVRVLKRDPYNAQDLSEAETEGREGVRGFFKFLKTVPGFEKSFLIDVAPNIGVRDSRRIMGEYMLTIEDVFQSRTFDDAIALKVPRGPKVANWVMHPPDGTEGSGTHRDVTESPLSVMVFGIPYRCLLPKDVEQLLVAGKTVSMTYDAHSRCRMMPDCIAFGQAAGAAAAMAVKQGISPREVDTKALTALLTKQGVNLNQNSVNVQKIKEIMIERGSKVEG